jgi:hypothetical protein
MKAGSQASLGSSPEARAVPREAVLSTAPPVTPKVETSSLGAPAALSSAQSPDTKPVRTVTLRPDGAQIATPVLIESTSPTDAAPKPPAVSGPVAMTDAFGIERPVKSDSPTKYPPARSPSQVVVAKREATGHAVAADTDNRPFLGETPVKTDRAATEPKSPQAATDPIPVSETPGEAARQSLNCMLHTFGVVFGERSPLWRSPTRSPRRPAGRSNWPRQDQRPRPRAILVDSAPSMPLHSRDRRSACAGLSSMARRSTVCVSATCPGPTPQLFAQDRRTTAAAASWLVDWGTSSSRRQRK